MKYKYTFNTLKDNTKMGVINELQNGLTTMAVYFATSHGLPLEIFNEQISKMSLIEQLDMYMRFRNENKKLFAN